MDFPVFSCFIHFLPSPCVHNGARDFHSPISDFTGPTFLKGCRSAMRLWWFSWTSRAWDFSRAFQLHWCGVRHDFCGLGGNFGSSTARMQACYWGWEKCVGKQGRTHQATPPSKRLPSMNVTRKLLLHKNPEAIPQILMWRWLWVRISQEVFQ